MPHTSLSSPSELTDAGAHAMARPSDWIVRFAPLVTAGQSLLDVACGHGRHARFFAERGVAVTAVDRDATALESLAHVNGVVTERRDLEVSGAPWPYEAERFDTVVVCNYLWRPTFDALIATIKPGGVLLYETFMDGNERYGKPSRPAFLLRSNELIDLLRDEFVIRAYEEGDDVDAEGKVFAVKARASAIKRVQ